MNDETFNTLKIEVDTDLELNKNNIIEKNLLIPKLYNKYLNIYNKELKLYKDYLLLKDKTYGELFHYYKFDYHIKLDKKTDIDPYINNDIKFNKICYKLNNQEIYIKWIEKILDNIKQMGYSIKNFIEYQKFLNGSN